MSKRRRSFPFDSRRLVRLLEPSVELRLPLYLGLATVAFMAAFTWNGFAAFERMAQFVLVDDPEIRKLLWGQTRAFLVVSGTIVTGYILVVFGTCLAFTHRLIGPRVALGRQIEALKNGDYSARVQLRDGDVAFQNLARDLNDLGQILERAEKRWN